MPLTRRSFLKSAATGALFSATRSKAATSQKTRFQVACMTLPYSQFSLERALKGIYSAGYQYVAWGIAHKENGKDVPVMAASAPPAEARTLGDRSRDSGLIPLMMFSEVYPEHARAIEIFTSRIKQASAAGIPQVLTFGHTAGGNRPLWIKRFRELAPIAQDHGVTIVLKQHGGETGTGTACADIVREIDRETIKVNYDAGNVMDYLNVDPIPDVQKCASEIRSFCIKDHRNFPKDEDCGPGFGEIDHYKLLHPVAFSDLSVPLCCENISAPLLPRPTDPAAVDQLARRAREFLETVITGIQRSP